VLYSSIRLPVAVRMHRPSGENWHPLGKLSSEELAEEAVVVVVFVFVVVSVLAVDANGVIAIIMDCIDVVIAVVAVPGGGGFPPSSPRSRLEEASDMGRG
jgi:hypothetical protein